MSQIATKFIADNAVTELKARLSNAAYLRARNAANSADVNILRVNSSNVIEFASLPQASGTPSSGNDLVNKTYADSITGTGANTALSNLASVAVNTDLLPGTTATLDFGSSSKTWVSAFIGSLKDASSVIAVDAFNRTLKSSAGVTRLNFASTFLATTGDLRPSVTATDSIGAPGTSYLSLVVNNATDDSGNVAIQFFARTLKNSSGTTLIDFSGSNPQTATTPSAANDITNKAYVDSVASAQKTWNLEALTLNGTDITNQYKDLAQVAVTGSIFFLVNGLWQRPTTDYTISYTGGAGGKTRLTFAGDLATGGGAELVSGDVIYIQYQY